MCFVFLSGMSVLLLFSWRYELGKETISFEFSFLISKIVRNVSSTFLLLLGGLSKFWYVKCQAYRNYTYKIKFPSTLYLSSKNLTRNTGAQLLRDTVYVSELPMMAQPNHQAPTYSIEFSQVHRADAEFKPWFSRNFKISELCHSQAVRYGMSSLSSLSSSLLLGKIRMITLIWNHFQSCTQHVKKPTTITTTVVTFKKLCHIFSQLGHLLHFLITSREYFSFVH